jgi:hypothetical protein
MDKGQTVKNHTIIMQKVLMAIDLVRGMLALKQLQQL